MHHSLRDESANNVIIFWYSSVTLLNIISWKFLHHFLWLIINHFSYYILIVCIILFNYIIEEISDNHAWRITLYIVKIHTCFTTRVLHAKVTIVAINIKNTHYNFIQCAFCILHLCTYTKRIICNGIIIYINIDIDSEVAVTKVNLLWRHCVEIDWQVYI